MNNFFIIGGIGVKQHDLDVLSGVLLVLSGSYQFTSLKTMCLGYCQSPMSFFMRRWKGGVSGAIKMGTYHGLYCLGCCWPYFLLMVALGWMSLLWMALFAVIIFAEKVWSRARGGLWVARIAGIGFVVVGLLNIFGIITLQNTVANTFNSSSGSAMLPPDNGNGIHSDMHNMQMGINHNHH
jgi:predicted metal-binding membrane protein